MRRPQKALLFAGICVLGAASLVFSCKEKPKPTDGGGSVIRTLTKEDSEKVLVKIGDQAITLGDYAATLEHLDQFERLRYQSPERRKELLKEMINIELLAKEARDKGYDKDPVVEEEKRSILREAMLAEVRKSAPRPEDISIEDAKAYFDAHLADFRDPERRRLSVIVTRSEADGKAALESAKATKTAAEWGEIVRKRSVDPAVKPTLPVDLVGDVGFVAPPGDPRGDNLRVPEPVRAAAFKIANVGDVLAEVVKGGDFFYVVRLSGKNEPRERCFSEAERTIRAKLAQDKMREKERAFVEELKKDIKVEIDEAVLSELHVETPQPSSGDAGSK